MGIMHLTEQAGRAEASDFAADDSDAAGAPANQGDDSLETGPAGTLPPSEVSFEKFPFPSNSEILKSINWCALVNTFGEKIGAANESPLQKRRLFNAQWFAYFFEGLC